MAPIKSMDAIVRGRELQVLNHVNMLRDFTCIDDIVKGICLVLNSEDTQEVPARIYNIGNSHDVVRTYADTSRLQKDFGYKPNTTLRQGITRLYEWYMGLYGDDEPQRNGYHNTGYNALIRLLVDVAY